MSRRRTVVLELVKQLPAILASLALVVTAAEGCRQRDRLATQEQSIERLKGQSQDLAEQVVSVSTIEEPEEGEFE